MKNFVCHCGRSIFVDDEDYSALHFRTWFCASRNVQCKFNGKNRNISHFIKGTPPKGLVWDHIDKDAHNNVRSNFRLVTQEQNLMNKNVYKNNKSGCPGVSWIDRDQIWRATGNSEGKKKWIGDFHSLQAAIAARKKFEKENYQIEPFNLKFILQ